MKNLYWKNSIHWALLVVALPTVAGAVEIQLRREARPTGDLVRLGDVAKVFAEKEEAERLSRIPLFPAPAAGQRRYVRVREIQDALDAHGVNLTRYRFSGSSQVAIGQRSIQAPAEPIKAVVRRNVQVDVQQAITDYLNVTADGSSWQVTVQLDKEQSRQLAIGEGVIRASGGRPPWSGRQKFEIHLTSATGAVTTTVVEAVVRAPQIQVVAVRSLRRGTIVRAEDVELRTTDANLRGRRIVEGFDKIESVLGMETSRAITMNQPISVNAVRQPLLVRRGDVVTVYARTSGIVVRTVARAREEGGQGELIEVESLTKDRKKYDVRITGQGTASVLTLGSMATR